MRPALKTTRASVPSHDVTHDLRGPSGTAWHWSSETGEWTLLVRRYTRGELDAIEAQWRREGWSRRMRGAHQPHQPHQPHCDACGEQPGAIVQNTGAARGPSRATCRQAGTDSPSSPARRAYPSRLCRACSTDGRKTAPTALRSSSRPAEAGTRSARRTHASSPSFSHPAAASSAEPRPGDVAWRPEARSGAGLRRARRSNSSPRWAGWLPPLGRIAPPVAVASFWERAAQAYAGNGPPVFATFSGPTQTKCSPRRAGRWRDGADE